MFDQDLFAQRAIELCDVGRFLFSHGWCPATSSNFSVRLDAEHVAITVSGRPKGELRPEDIMCVDLQGRPVACGDKPSAETLLHTSLYQHDPKIGAVLHTHSVPATVLSRHHAAAGAILLEDYEVLKAFSGVSTHAGQMQIPVFPNTQDIPALAAAVSAWLRQPAGSSAPLGASVQGYCIAGHGLYTWGAHLMEARRHVEAFEFLFECEILRSRLRPG